MARWGKLYGTLHGSPKWRRASKGARALWTTAFAWCVDQEATGGVVPWDMLRALDGTRHEADELVSVGLWERGEDGWCFHDWEDHQDSREQMDERRKAAVERQRRARDRRVSHGVTNGVSHTTSRAEQSRAEKESSIELSPAAVAAEAFDGFWATYPRRDDKGHAVKAFTAAMRKTDAETIVAGARRFATMCERERRERRFIPLASTWLNGERWDDEPGGATSRGEQPSRQEFNITDLRLAGLLPPDPPHTHRPSWYSPVVIPDDA